jgi:exportin-1
VIKSLPFVFGTLQVCLDYWNIFVLELFEAHNQMEPAATVSMMGLQVLSFVPPYFLKNDFDSFDAMLLFLILRLLTCFWASLIKTAL